MKTLQFISCVLKMTAKITTNGRNLTHSLNFLAALMHLALCEVRRRQNTSMRPANLKPHLPFKMPSHTADGGCCVLVPLPLSTSKVPGDLHQLPQLPHPTVPILCRLSAPLRCCTFAHLPLSCSEPHSTSSRMLKLRKLSHFSSPCRSLQHTECTTQLGGIHKVAEGSSIPWPCCGGVEKICPQIKVNRAALMAWK